VTAGGLVVLDCGHTRDGVDELIAETDIAIFAHAYPAALHGEDVDIHRRRRRVPRRVPPCVLEDGLGRESVRFANVAAARKCEGMTGRAPIPPEDKIWRWARR
jgi:hypothetical protein